MVWARRSVWVALGLSVLAARAGAQDADLAAGFREPGPTARPHTWWHWMNGNITREGITADLEAMRQIGLGGAQIFNVSEWIPEGPILFMSPEWRELLAFAVREADRLGLELCLHNCAGWSSSGGPWIKPEQAMQMVVVSQKNIDGPASFSDALPQPETRHEFYRDIAVLAFPTLPADSRRIKDYRIKAGFEPRYGQHPHLENYPTDALIQKSALVDLTQKLAPDGKLTWEVPAGKWTILRFGYTPTGAQNAPSPPSGRGLECDKLSRAGLDAHWAGMMAPVIQDLGPLAGKVLNNALIDSYEMGGQNWTPGFREEFRRRRGYDVLPFLPVLAGRVVESGEVSERFLWDFRRTIADLFADNYYSYFVELCHQNGLLASIEPYDGPFECLQVGRDADIPMGEFWVGGGESESCKLAASVAHTGGRRLVGAESFTAAPNAGRWQNHPFALKAVGDLMYCTGINRYIIHRYAHQPWPDQLPGMTMGQWGTHFERTVTWWQPGAAWIKYLTRCQYLLQQGLFVADVCCFDGEAAPGNSPLNAALKARGYDYDGCSGEVLLNRLSVRDGRLVLPDGGGYRLLVLPNTAFMTPGMLTRIRDLVQQGATVLGPKPIRSPSLAEYPDCDAAVRRLADEIWGDCDGKKVKERAFGAGRVYTGLSPEEVLAAMKVQPDCEFSAASGKPKMAWIHRVAGDADIYFVSNQAAQSSEVSCTFRVSGKAPELWHPDSGEIEVAPLWSEKDGRITVPIRFDPAGSVFVVFRKNARGGEHFVALRRADMQKTEAAGPKLEITRAVYEAINGAGGADVTGKVAELVSAGEMRIPASNATFGDPAYGHTKRLRIEYTLDGKPLTVSADEGGTAELVEAPPVAPAALPAWKLARLDDHAVELLAFQPGTYEIEASGGRVATARIDCVPEAMEIGGPWTVRFPPDRGAPPAIKLDTLISWTQHADAGVKYFSGTAEYEREFDIPAGVMLPERALYLDLGAVKCLAEVTLNGHDLGVWWKPPFAAKVTSFLNPGPNRLKIRVTNLWINRLIGDEQQPADCEWDGMHLKAWPKWLHDHQPRPVPQRLTFTTWRHYRKESPLVESGLLGPVRIQFAQRVRVD